MMLKPIITLKTIFHYFSAHPYIFFNNDGMTLTFVGFMVSSKGHLVDAKKRTLEKAIMSVPLKEALKQQGVDFEDNYNMWKKDRMISVAGNVMGLDQVRDPDPSYVLTVDNLIKILAIQMRFRCVLYTSVFLFTLSAL